MLALAKSNPRVDFLGDGAIKSGLGAALKTGIFLGDSIAELLLRLLVLRANSCILVLDRGPFLGVLITLISYSMVSVILLLLVD